ncbi:MAG: stage V sporulation protein AB [Eubacteriaceae bacterium]
MNYSEVFFVVFIGFSAGLSVGTSVISFLVILRVIPRIIEIFKESYHIYFIEIALALGSVVSSVIYLNGFSIKTNFIVIIFLGLLIGVFIGMLAGALNEILNVVPIVTKRLAIEKYDKYILISLSLGKTVGSLVYWLIPFIW